MRSVRIITLQAINFNHFTLISQPQSSIAWLIVFSACQFAFFRIFTCQIQRFFVIRLFGCIKQSYLFQLQLISDNRRMIQVYLFYKTLFTCHCMLLIQFQNQFRPFLFYFHFRTYWPFGNQHHSFFLCITQSFSIFLSSIHTIDPARKLFLLIWILINFTITRSLSLSIDQSFFTWRSPSSNTWFSFSLDSKWILYLLLLSNNLQLNPSLLYVVLLKTCKILHVVIISYFILQSFPHQAEFFMYILVYVIYLIQFFGHVLVFYILNIINQTQRIITQ